MNRETFDENTLRRYLLGELIEDENARVEAAAFSGDGELLARVEATENDLIDEYARGELSENETASFELMFLNSPERVKRIEFARAFGARLNTEKSMLAARNVEARNAQNVERTSFWTTLSGLFAQPQIAFGALALFILIGGILAFFNSRRNETEIAQQENASGATLSNQAANLSNNRTTENPPPSNSVNQTNSVNRNLASSNAAPPNVSPSPQKSNQNKSPNVSPTPAPETDLTAKNAAPTFATLVFPIGMTRDGGGGKILQLKLAPNAKGARFVFNLDAGDDEYKNYEIELRGKSGAFASTTRAVRSGRVVSFNLSADKLPAGRYEAVLRGVAGGSAGATIGYYDFEIVKP